MKRSICLFIIGVMTTLGCSAKEPFLKQEVQEVSATVEAIDTENRLISLRGPAGTATILAGPDIVNFPQIHVGDQVKVKYTVAVAANITKSKATPTTKLDTAGVYRARGFEACRFGGCDGHDDRADRVGGYVLRDRDFQASGWLRAHHRAGVTRREEVHQDAEEGRHGGRVVHRGAGDFG